MKRGRTAEAVICKILICENVERKKRLEAKRTIKNVVKNNSSVRKGPE